MRLAWKDRQGLGLAGAAPGAAGGAAGAGRHPSPTHLGHVADDDARLAADGRGAVGQAAHEQGHQDGQSARVHRLDKRGGRELVHAVGHLAGGADAADQVGHKGLNVAVANGGAALGQGVGGGGAHGGLEVHHAVGHHGHNLGQVDLGEAGREGAGGGGVRSRRGRRGEAGARTARRAAAPAPLLAPHRDLLGGGGGQVAQELGGSLLGLPLGVGHTLRRGAGGQGGVC